MTKTTPKVVSYSREEVRKMEDHTDWEQLRDLTEEEIRERARNDPDAPPLTPEEIKEFGRPRTAEEIREFLRLRRARGSAK